MGAHQHHSLTAFTLALALIPNLLDGQVPVQIAPPGDTLSKTYVNALKEAVLSSGTFVLETASANSRRLWVSVIVGGTVTCGDAQFRGVALVIEVSPHTPDERQVMRATVYQVGEEKDDARAMLLTLHQAAEMLGVRERPR